MITPAQLILLERMGAGQSLWFSDEAECWFIRPDPHCPSVHVNFKTVAAVTRAGLIEPTGLLYWRRTDAGRAAIANEGSRQ